MRRSAWSRLTRPLLALAVLIAWILPATATSGPAAAQQSPLVVEVTSLDPLNPTPGGTVTVSGTIANRSDSSIEDVRAMLRASRDSLVSRSAVTAITDNPGDRRGIAVQSSDTAVADALAPGAAVAFRLTAATADLPIGGNGVYAVFVEVTSSSGTARTAFPMPWIPDPAALQPSSIVVMTPLRSAVDLTALNALQSARLLASLAEGGALHELATSGTAAADSGVPMAWLIDPAVTGAAESIASGNAALPSTVEDPVAARQSVAAWLGEVAAGEASEASLSFATPYAEVDGPGVLAAGLPSLVTQSVAAAQAAPGRDGLLYPAPEGTTADTLAAYSDAGVSTVIVAEAALPPDEQLTYTPSGVADLALPDGRGLTALIPDERLAADLQRPTGTASQRFQLQAAVLAQAAMITLELPTSSRTVLMLPASDTALPADLYTGILTALSAAPYTRLVGLPTLLDPATTRVDRSLRSGQSGAAPLSASYLAPIPGLQQRLDAFARVTVDPVAFAADYQAAILRASSADWRTDLDAGEALLASVAADLDTQEQKVTTVSTGTVTFTGSRGTLPLTVSNGLDQAVDVRILLRSDPQVRLASEPTDAVRVDAGKRVSVEIPVEVFGSGPLPVTVILTDAAGQPFIETASLTIRTAGGSLVAAVIAGIAGLALLILVLWRFRRKGGDA